MTPHLSTSQITKRTSPLLFVVPPLGEFWRSSLTNRRTAELQTTVDCQMPDRVRTKRQGMTLLEVVLALAILAMALGLLGQLVQTGARAAAAARDETRAQLACESVLAGVVAGAIAAQSVDGAPYEADPEWSYSLDVQPANTYGLISVRVSVVQNIADAIPPHRVYSSPLDA